jgi:hypothetical protein
VKIGLGKVCILVTDLEYSVSPPPLSQRVRDQERAQHEVELKIGLGTVTILISDLE